MNIRQIVQEEKYDQGPKRKERNWQVFKEKPLVWTQEEQWWLQGNLSGVEKYQTYVHVWDWDDMMEKIDDYLVIFDQKKKKHNKDYVGDWGGQGKGE